MESGEQCVMISGISLMQLLYASSLVSLVMLRQSLVHSLDVVCNGLIVLCANITPALS